MQESCKASEEAVRERGDGVVSTPIRIKSMAQYVNISYRQISKIRVKGKNVFSKHKDETVFPNQDRKNQTNATNDVHK